MIQRFLCISMLVCSIYVQIKSAHETNLDELIVLEQPMLVVDEQTRALCKTLTDIYVQLEGTTEELLPELSNEIEEISYPCILRAVKACLQAPWPADEQWSTLRYELLELYDELLQDYTEALVQPGIRRPHSKSVLNRCKIVTNELTVHDSALIDQLRVNQEVAEQLRVAHLFADNIAVSNLRVDVPNGVLHVADAIISGGPVVNADLAANSVNMNNIVDMSIIPSKLAFNTVETNPGEPKLLLLYRGSVLADGTTLSGAGISVTHVSTGQYIITFSAPYADPTYQIFVQVEDQILAPFVQIVNVTPTGFTVNLLNAMPAAVDAAFSFFTLGVSAA